MATAPTAGNPLTSPEVRHRIRSTIAAPWQLPRFWKNSAQRFASIPKKRKLKVAEEI
jgi:hypothetical protein